MNFNFAMQLSLGDALHLLAGMPSLRLAEDTTHRFQAISFFLLMLGVSSLVLWKAWNWLRSDFTFMPKLSFPGAMGLTVLWGMMFIIVLTMISGARELMTPGAWKPKGLTYELAGSSTDDNGQAAKIAQQRENEIKLVAATLKYYQKTHDGKSPFGIEGLVIAADELGFASLKENLELNYWFDPSFGEHSPILLRQLAPRGEAVWGVTAEGLIVRLDEEEQTARADEVQPEPASKVEPKSTSESDDS